MPTVEAFDAITVVTYILFVFLILAICVERSLEVLMAGYKYVEMKRGWYKYWNRLGVKYQHRFDKLYGFLDGNASHGKGIMNWVLWMLVIPNEGNPNQARLAVEAIRFIYIRLGARIVAFLLSLILTLIVSDILNTDLVLIIKQILANEGGASGLLNKLENSEFWRIVISAAAVSIGSEPLHFLITRVERMGQSKSD